MSDTRKHLFDTGDADSLTYGGGRVFDNDGTIQWEFWDEPTDADGSEIEPENATYTVYRVDVPDDVCCYHDWANWSAVSAFSGSDVWLLGRSTDMRDRVNCLESLILYYSPENLDQYPIQLAYSEMLERYPSLV